MLTSAQNRHIEKTSYLNPSSALAALTQGYQSRKRGNNGKEIEARRRLELCSFCNVVSYFGLLCGLDIVNVRSSNRACWGYVACVRADR